MARLNKRKLNHLAVSAPSGVVLTTAWLLKQGISPRLAWWYVHSGLLERLGSKAYKKTGDSISWAGAVAALQGQMNLSLHVGGRTALQLLGLSHFVPVQGLKQVALFADAGTSVPGWLAANDFMGVQFLISKTSLFHGEDSLLGVIERSVEGIALQISCPERAAMEMLYSVPARQSFDEAVLLMENLGQLRPAMVQSLLEKCNSIKVKRLFLCLSEKFQHSWFSTLNLKNINLGRGKRVIGSGGKYDSKYQLSLPKLTEDQSGF